MSARPARQPFDIESYKERVKRGKELELIAHKDV